MSIECIAAIGAAATIIAGFGGAALGSFFAYKTGMKLVQKTHANAFELATFNKFKGAGGNLRAAFAPAIAKYPLQRSSDFNVVDKMLRDEITIQAIAIEEFRPFVATERKEAYQKAWENYHRPEGAGRSVFFLEYTNEKLFKDRIHAILQFTEK